jgi:putative flippase GtrA
MFERFVVVGCANLVVSFAALCGTYHYLPLGDLGARGAMANVLAYAAGMLNSFLLNRVWTFRAEERAAVHGWRFTLLNAATLAASTLVVLVHRLGLHELAIWLPLAIAILAAHYLGMKRWVFMERT